MPQRQRGETRAMLRALVHMELIRSPQWGCLGVLLVLGGLYALRGFFLSLLLAFAALLLFAFGAEKKGVRKWALWTLGAALLLLAVVLLLPEPPPAA